MKCSILERANDAVYFLAHRWLAACSNEVAGARFWLLRIIQLVSDLVTFMSSILLLLLLGNKPHTHVPVENYKDLNRTQTRSHVLTIYLWVLG
jgi:hypothetical protein